MSNTFSFTGKISRRKENAYQEKTFDSGWMIKELNLMMTCGDNVQFLRANGGMWDSAHASKNSVMTFKHNDDSKDEQLTVDWDKRFDPDIIKTVANYRTYTVDTEIKQDREAIEKNGDQAAIDASNKKHKTFITAVDFVEWLNKVTSNEKTKNWVWRVTGEIEYSYNKGKYYSNYVPRRVYHVADDTEPVCIGTFKTYFSDDCVNEGEDKTVFNVYSQYYDSQAKKNVFVPTPLVIANDHPKAKGYKKLFSKVENDEVKEFGVNVQYINGAQKVEITEDMINEEQKELLDMGMITMDEIRRDLGDSVYGDRVTEIRITDIARGYTSGPKETAYEASDLVKPPVKDEPKTKTDDDSIDLFDDSDEI